MQDDILRTLDGLDALRKASTPGKWKKEGAGLVSFINGEGLETFGTRRQCDDDTNYIVALHNAYPALSSALRRAMAVVEGIREIDFPDFNCNPTQQPYEIRNQTNDYCRSKLDRLLSENGFKE